MYRQLKRKNVHVNSNVNSKQANSLIQSKVVTVKHYKWVYIHKCHKKCKQNNFEVYQENISYVKHNHINAPFTIVY